MSEETLVRYCSPTLAGIKTGSLFGCEFASQEELTAEIKVGDLIKTLEYDYPKFHLSMDCFWAEIISGELVLKEAESARWLTKAEFNTVKWLPADEELVEKIKEIL